MDTRFTLNLPPPHPDLDPQEVVKIQLDALQNNDLVLDDEGIRLAFDYTSPSNRRILGPVERFITVVKNSLFRTMIGFEHAELEPVRFVERRVVQQRVHVFHDEGHVEYVFLLSEQKTPPFTACWMTDGVILPS